MNYTLARYFEFVSFVLGIMSGISINFITSNLNINIYVSCIVLFLSVGIFFYGSRIKKQLESIEYNIENSNWLKKEINNTDVWICENNPMFQIRNNNKYKDFTEQWTQVFPAKLGSGRYYLEVIKNGVIIDSIAWIYCDDGRISVPMPNIENLDNTPEGLLTPKINYYWLKESLGYKLSKICGEFYIYENMERISQITKVEIK